MKVMIFIDGSWLYHNLPTLRKLYGDPNFTLDYGKLPRFLAVKAAELFRTAQVDPVRWFLFGSIPINYDPQDEGLVEDQQDFYDMLKEDFHYEVELFPIDFRGRRIRREDRRPNDPFQPKEKRVDIGLATALLYYAAIPFAYDVAITLLGDEDYVPVLQHVRRLGKRVMVVSIKESCDPVYIDPVDELRLRDVDTVFLESYLSELAFAYERRPLECASPYHSGPSRVVYTTFRPRRGQRFYCEVCRQQDRIARQEAKEALRAKLPPELQMEIPEGRRVGIVERVVAERGFGFIRTADDEQYFFHVSQLATHFDWNSIKEGHIMEFTPSQDPQGRKQARRLFIRPMIG